MGVHQDILSVACTLTRATEEDRQTLRRFCSAAEANLRRRLRRDTAVEDCYDSFVTAAALLAAADFSAACAGIGVKQFSAGPVSITREDEKSVRSLREQAAVLMAPWCQDAFRFLEVEG